MPISLHMGMVISSHCPSMPYTMSLTKATTRRVQKDVESPIFPSSATTVHACVECIVVLASNGILLEGVCIGGSSLNVRTLLDLHTTLTQFRNTTHFQVF